MAYSGATSLVTSSAEQPIIKSIAPIIMPYIFSTFIAFLLNVYFFKPFVVLSFVA